jgi:hypothetical protein
MSIYIKFCKPVIIALSIMLVSALLFVTIPARDALATTQITVSGKFMIQDRYGNYEGARTFLVD